MADFLPIKLGKNASGIVTHLQEISLSDKIPETFLQVSSNTIAKWNASSIQGVHVSSLSPSEGFTLVYSSSVSAWVPSTISVDAQTVSLTLVGNSGNTGAILDPSSQQVRQIFVSNDGVLLSVSSTSATPDGTFYVTSGGSVVPVYLPSYLLRYFGSNGASSYPTQISKGGIELSLDFYENPIVYVDTTNDRWTWTNQLLIRNTGVLATNVSATNVSATNYLNIGNTTAKWNASAIQGSPVSAGLSPLASQALVYNGSAWTASTISVITDHGALTGLADDDHPQYVLSSTNSALSSIVSNHITSASVHFTQAEIDHGSILGLADNDHPQYVLSATNNALSSTVSNHIASSTVHFTQAQIDHGVILGLSDNDHPQYVLSATNSALSSLVDNHIASATVHFTQAQIDHGVILGLTDNDHPQYVLSATNSALSSLVTNHITSSTVHFTQAEIDHGVILGLADNDHPQYVLSATNSALSSLVNNHIASAVHWDLATLNANYINASGDSANAAFYFQTVSAITVSATNYVNLPTSFDATSIQGYNVDNTAPGAGDVLVWDDLNSFWTPSTIPTGGGGGVTDHGALTGLSDNDHPQYVLSSTNSALSSLVTNHIASAVHWELSTLNINYINASGDSANAAFYLQTVSATTISATNYVNLPTTTTEWYQAYQAQAVVKYVKNQTGVTLAKGTPVTVTGVAGDIPLVGILSSVNTHVPEAMGFANHTFGLIKESIAHDAFGYVVTEGLVSGTGGDNLNTNAFNVTDVLYVSSNGQLSNTRPPAPYEGHPVGYVIRKHANVGAIYVKVETTPELNDIVGFNLTSSLINGDLISYDTATSTFTNVQAVNVSGQGKFGSVSATNYLNLPSGVATWNANKLQGYDISAVAPSNDQVLKYNSTLSAWVPGTDNTGGGGGGGISDASSLRGSPLSATLGPTAGQALMYNGSVWTASAALFAYTYGSGAPTGGSDGDIYLQTDVVALQVPSVSATNYYNLPSGTLVWTYATSATSALYATNATSATLALNATSATSALYSTNATSATLALNATSATSALNARQAPAGFDVTGMLTAASGDVSSTRLTDYSEKKSAPTISSSALTLDLNNSQVFTVALNSNISTLTISNPDPRTNTAQGFTLILTADGTARTITWPGSVKWPSGTGPTLTSTNNKVDILSFLSPDNGTTWYGFTGGQNF